MLQKEVEYYKKGPTKDHQKLENLKENVPNLFLMPLGIESKRVRELQWRPTLTMKSVQEFSSL